MQWIFNKKNIDFITDNKLLFSVDEDTYSRSLKCNYSRLPLGKNSAIINSNRMRKANVLFGMSADGNWLAVISDTTTEAPSFDNIYSCWINSYNFEWK